MAAEIGTEKTQIGESGKLIPTTQSSLAQRWVLSFLFVGAFCSVESLGREDQPVKPLR